MKFLKINKFLTNTTIESNPLNNYSNTIKYIYSNHYYDKLFIKKSKFISKSKVGIIKNIKKSSIKMNKLKSFSDQYLSLIHKNGKKNVFFKNLNISIENLSYSLTRNIEDFNVYKNYNNFVFLFNNNLYYSNFNNLFDYLIKDLYSIFEIKTIKNNKKLKLTEKYKYEIVYIPKEKRNKYTLRALSLYKESFKKYNLWERIFWSFFLIILNQENSFLKKRRNYIYSKSIKFFKVKKSSK